MSQFQHRPREYSEDFQHFGSVQPGEFSLEKLPLSFQLSDIRMELFSFSLPSIEGEIARKLPQIRAGRAQMRALRVNESSAAVARSTSR